MGNYIYLSRKLHPFKSSVAILHQWKAVVKFEEQVYKVERLRGVFQLCLSWPDCWILKDIKRFSFGHREIDMELRHTFLSQTHWLFHRWHTTESEKNQIKTIIKNKVLVSTTLLSPSMEENKKIFQKLGREKENGRKNKRERSHT